MEIDSSSKRVLQLVVFTVADIEYAIDILDVREIIRAIGISSANKREFINLRGRAVPVINMRERFGLENRNDNDNSRIIIIDVSGAVLGLNVDSVNEVFRVPCTDVHPFDPTCTIWSKKYIKKVVRIDKREILSLDLEKLIQ